MLSTLMLVLCSSPPQKHKEQTVYFDDDVRRIGKYWWTDCNVHFEVILSHGGSWCKSNSNSTCT